MLPRRSSTLYYAQELQSLASEREPLREKSESLQRRLGEVKAEESHIRGHMLQARESHQKLEHPMRLTILHLSISECRDFATKFHTALPPELRELVYKHAWKGKRMTYTPGVKQEFYGTPWLHECKDKICSCFSLRDSVMWALPLFVGYNVAREAAAVYYHITRSLVNHLHLGVRPADHMRALLIYINISRASSSRFEGYDLDGPFSEEGRAWLEKDFDALRALRLKLRFHLTIKLYHTITSVQLRSVLKQLVPAYRELKQGGARVTFLTGPDTTSTLAKEAMDMISGKASA